MNLRDAIARLNGFDDTAHIFVAGVRPISADSKVFVGRFDDDDNPPVEAAGLSPLFTVYQTREIINGKAMLAGKNDMLTSEEKLAMLLDYLARDA